MPLLLLLAICALTPGLAAAQSATPAFGGAYSSLDARRQAIRANRPALRELAPSVFDPLLVLAHESRDRGGPRAARHDEL